METAEASKGVLRGIEDSHGRHSRHKYKDNHATAEEQHRHPSDTCLRLCPCPCLCLCLCLCCGDCAVCRGLCCASWVVLFVYDAALNEGAAGTGTLIHFS